MSKLIDGTIISAEVKEQCRLTVQSMREKGYRAPKLSVLLIGEHAPSIIYVNSKKKTAEQLGIAFDLYHLPADTSQQEVITIIDKLNADTLVDGIFIQMPLPKQIDSDFVISRLDPNKDADGLHPLNLGKLMTKKQYFVPCTPAGCLRLIESTNVSLTGKRAVIIGRSILVGKPMAFLLDQLDMTVTICHSKTQNIEEICKTADVLVVAVGKPKWIKKEWVKEEAIVIDVGINRTEDNKIVGDVDFDDVEPIASHITPVPKGVGPMTIAMLMENTVRAYQNHMQGGEK